jgi:hypothetical protein
MKKLWIASILALLALAFVAAPAMAWSYADAEVTCDEITASEDNIQVGDTIYFYGSVTVVAEARNHDNYCGDHEGTWAEVNACVKYIIKDPEGNVLDVGYIPLSDYDQETGWGNSDAYINETIPWTSDPIFIEMAGDYLACQKGCVEASYGYWYEPFLYKYWEGGWWWGHWVYVYGDPIFVEDDSVRDRCRSCQTFTAHSNAPLSTGRLRPILTVLTPVDSELFFSSDGWGDPTTDDIVHNDGIWQVEIADGTRIMLDGEWHRKTWIEVDDQGNVIGRYGSDGHIIATEIGLSSPIKVTKVG